LRTDVNNNPTAFTTDLAAQAGLVEGVDYVPGTVFPTGKAFQLVTAKIIGDPIAVTIKLIDAVGYFTKTGQPRWIYIALPRWVWNSLTQAQRVDIIGWHYQHEGGVTMRGLFPNYGKLA
jgi:hypothetical protein